jgi:hypothetical protein
VDTDTAWPNFSISVTVPVILLSSEDTATDVPVKVSIINMATSKLILRLISLSSDIQIFSELYDDQSS